MGFFGDFVLLRTDRRPALGEDAACEEGHAECVEPLDSPWAGGWQMVQVGHGLPGGPRRAVGKLVAATGSPAVVARVMDSDVCQAFGLAPSGESWETFLDPAMAEDYDIPVPAPAELPATVARITRWAAEAGCTADPAALHLVLTRPADPFVEDLFFELIDACGLPAALSPNLP